jgi:hypothetical protein
MIYDPLIYIMRTSILQYCSNPAEDCIIYEALKSANVQVCRIQNLSKLHTTLESRSFDAILVSNDIIELYKIPPARHLWEHRSRHTIMVWEINEDGLIICKSYSIPVEISGYPQIEGHNGRIAQIQSILTKINILTEKKKTEQQTALNPESISQFDDAHNHAKSLILQNIPNKPRYLPVFPAGTDIHLHKKMETILKILVDAGFLGITIPEICEKVWGKKTKDRKKDIQIYISKLRTILAAAFPNRYSISLNQGKYRFQDAEDQ